MYVLTRYFITGTLVTPSTNKAKRSWKRRKGGERFSGAFNTRPLRSSAPVRASTPQTAGAPHTKPGSGLPPCFTTQKKHGRPAFPASHFCCRLTVRRSCPARSGAPWNLLFKTERYLGFWLVARLFSFLKYNGLLRWTLHVDFPLYFPAGECFFFYKLFITWVSVFMQIDIGFVTEKL